MAATDSTHVFEKRLATLGIAELVDKFRAFGWNSYGNFAFAVPAVSGGSTDPDLFLRDVLRPLFDLSPDAPAPPKAAAVRRLFFEAHTFAVGEVRARAERTEGDPPRRIPQAEREARRDALSKRLAPAFVLEGDLEPAHHVVDKFVNMVEHDTIEYIKWEQVATRKAELRAGPGQRRWTATASGTIKEVIDKDAPAVSVNTHWEISTALRRRSVALEMAGLMTFEAHEKLHARLMKALTEQPGDAAYVAPTVDRVRAADAFVWEKLASALARGARPAGVGDAPPADAALTTIMGSMEFELRLGPLPRPAGARARRDDDDRDPEDAPAGKRRRRTQAQRNRATSSADPAPAPNRELEDLRRQVRDLRAAAAAPPRGGDRDADKGRGKGGNKGGGKGDRRDFVPRALAPGVGRTAAGDPICFDYNMAGCNNARDGERCSRGVHVCTKIGCQRAHPAGRCNL